MLFHIDGSDAVTGKDRSVVVEAADERAAASQAKAEGVYPYRVILDTEAERARRDALLEAEAARRQREANARDAAIWEERRREKDRRIDAKMAELRVRIASGQAVYLHRSVYLAVDSLLMDKQLSPPFDIGSLHKLGIEGWEIVGTVPRTVGVGLQNTSVGSVMGSSWGGGSGGNVVGVYVLLRKLVTSLEGDEAVGEMRAYIEVHLL